MFESNQAKANVASITELAGWLICLPVIHPSICLWKVIIHLYNKQDVIQLVRTLQITIKTKVVFNLQQFEANCPWTLEQRKHILWSDESGFSIWQSDGGV